MKKITILALLALTLLLLLVSCGDSSEAILTYYVDGELYHTSSVKEKDELFGNIAHYAYNPDVGDATVRVEVMEDPLAVVITFIDKGVPYDPLAKADPNTSLSAEEREIGGLGIFMVKKTMDDITYEYKDGQNILMIKKHI